MKYSPMLLTEAKKELPQGDQWSYEPKMDGYRLVAEISTRQVALLTRKGNDFTEKFPQVESELSEALSNRRAVVDGEIVGLNEEGEASFSILRRKRPECVYYIFDLLEIDGKPLINKSLEYRRNQLTEIFDPKTRLKDLAYSQTGIAS